MSNASDISVNNDSTIYQGTGAVPWKQATFDPAEVATIAKHFDLSETVATLLAIRGIETGDVERFLSPKLKDWLPDPFHLIDMGKAVDRIIKAIESDEKIAVFADYDVDGATSSALISRVMRHLGHEITIYVPDRIEEGYGPNLKAFNELADQGINLIITVDCGAVAYEPIGGIKERGVDVIVLDHHLGAEALPEAAAIVNPNRVDETTDLTYLAAAGVSFMTMVALVKRLKDTGKLDNTSAPDLLQYLDIVALGTVCDVMPLKALNRAFVSQGIKILKNSPNMGLKALLNVAGIDLSGTIKTSVFGFALGPRINAGGRVGEASLGAKLLTTDNEEMAQEYAAKLHHHNQERQAIEAETLEEAKALVAQMPEALFYILGQKHWHQGVIGIVAGRIKDEVNRPVAIMAIDEEGKGKASARSIPGVDMGEAIIKAKEAGLLIAGGGHAMAGGFTLEMTKLDDFKAFVEQQIQADVASAVENMTRDFSLSLPLSALTPDLYHEIQQLAPYGVSNPEPYICLPEVSLVSPKVLKGKHIQIVLSGQYSAHNHGSIRAIAFNCYDTPLGNHLLHAGTSKFNVYGKLTLDEWQGREYLSFHIADLSTL